MSKNLEIPKYICVDLDGTLIFSDLFWESLIVFIRKNILNFFLIILWFFRGRAYLKHKIAQNISNLEIDVSNLPYNLPLIDFLQKKHKEGYRIILATASNIKWANLIARHLNFFDDVFASNDVFNLKAYNKAKYLKEKLAKNDFVYIGDSFADFPVWNLSGNAIIVGKEKFVSRVKKKLPYLTIWQVFSRPSLNFKQFVKIFRLHQWTKNILIFLPLILAHKFNEKNLVINAMLAFFSFSFLASSVYIINDIFDLSYDRSHPSKKNRPLAKGLLSIPLGFCLVFFLVLFAFFLAFYLKLNFFLICLVYFILTNLYTFILKKIVILDVIVLASFYSIRIFAGSIVTNINVSEWLLSFSSFLFFSLALLKRYGELHYLNEHVRVVPGRAYQKEDEHIISIMGIVSGFISILVFALYLSSQKVIELYDHSKILWLSLIILTYGISYLWLKTFRKELNDDPVVFLLKDKLSIFLLLLLFAIFVFATI